jgi:hypothetical protein
MEANAFFLICPVAGGCVAPAFCRARPAQRRVRSDNREPPSDLDGFTLGGDGGRGLLAGTGDSSSSVRRFKTEW